MSSLPKIIVICGPTASGKTKMSLELAKKFGGEIVSADSRQIYRGMDVGTAKLKINNEELRMKNEATQHLVDIVDQDESYSVAEYQRDADRVIAEILGRGKVPFLVGGTGLYIDAVVERPNQLKIKNEKLKMNNKQQREEILGEIREKGAEMIYKELCEKCPSLAKDLDWRNPRRLVRAVEICKEFGDVERGKGERIYEVLKLGVEVDRLELYRRIDARVLEMMSAGLEEEARGLAEKYSWDLPAMSGIGYRQMRQYFAGEISREEAIALIQRDTRRYAKRQMTWFRGDPEIRWVRDAGEAEGKVREFLEK
ncbi:MAG: tRNA dimethylallyltransferase [Parcubacteria group bacterium Gr01-1014_18]|nr:MAG: tRNA dimethylallyltransferase [Parcubacteria group bacterium Greene0416_36]TSC79788.1 MAG: tRNA dimethylallyltransferase [Parcubacteria group bacterium Gr01-1014_18]TSC98072.1 MAG: tRNA dimethylallyltransferase [Parcubacteria group bacterium Greene1014_20]TSD06507.1 MAG: tRNA dimethylallyltransferase [Parcubacteria group bacterium Greene0714_2]